MDFVVEREFEIEHELASVFDRLSMSHYVSSRSKRLRQSESEGVNPEISRERLPRHRYCELELCEEPRLRKLVILDWSGVPKEPQFWWFWTRRCLENCLLPPSFSEKEVS